MEQLGTAGTKEMAVPKSAIAVWDFTWFPPEGVDENFVIERLKQIAKKWCFQLEECPETKKLHYQGRMSLKTKKRLKQAVEALDLKGAHLSASHCDEDDEYVSKPQTRVAGPWRNTDAEKAYIPRDVREITALLPWQQTLYEASQIYERRQIYYVYDPVGNNGKSIFTRWMMAHRHGQLLPFCNDYKDLMRMVMCVPDSKCYIIDMPRAINKEHLNQLYSGIESIKGGYAYDDRYHFKQKLFDPPVIIVFANKLPDRGMLSEDRWRIFGISEQKTLYEFRGEMS